MAGIPPTHTVAFVAGDALRFKFQVTDKNLDDPTAPAVVRDLTGWTARSQVRKTSVSDVIEATWTIETLGSDGYVRMYLSGPETQPFAAIKQLISDVEITDPNGDPETVLTIMLQASQDVTR